MTIRPTRLGPRARFAVLLPLAVVSVACTIELCTAPGGTATGTLSLEAQSTVPSISTTPGATPTTGTVPPTYLRPPVRISDSPLATTAAGSGVTAASYTDSTGDIPAVALAAYQRAATVMNAADATCHLPWQLIAGIGRVESDHGQAQGNTLGANGIDSPGIFGPVLNGKKGTAKVADSDGGTVDHDKTADRAVGPMQFLPSTWSMVAVDADGDGKRDPQDINDAALGAAAYLCANDGDLSATAGQKQAVFRYNHSWTYVHTVLGLANGYTSGTGTPLDVTTLPAVYTPTATPSTDDPGTPSHSEHLRVSVARAHTKGKAGGHTATSVTKTDKPKDVSVAGLKKSGSDTGKSTSSNGAPGLPAGDGKSGTPAPADPGVTPPPEPTPAKEVEDLTPLCQAEIEKTYPDASDATVSEAVTRCVKDLQSPDQPTITEDDAKAALDPNGSPSQGLVKQLDDEMKALLADFPDLEPTSPSASPTAEPSNEPSGDASDQASQTAPAQP